MAIGNPGDAGQAEPPLRPHRVSLPAASCFPRREGVNVGVMERERARGRTDNGRVRAPTRSSTPSVRKGTPLSAGSLLSLQRTAGNSAVATLVGHGRVPVQRIIDTTVANTALGAAQGFESYVAPTKPDPSNTTEPNNDPTEFARRVNAGVDRSRKACKALVTALQTYLADVPKLQLQFDGLKQRAQTPGTDPSNAIQVLEQLLDLLDAIATIEEATAGAIRLRDSWKNDGVSLVDPTLGDLITKLGGLNREKNRELMELSYDRVMLSSSSQVASTMNELRTGASTHMVIGPPLPRRKGPAIEGLVWQKDLFARGTPLSEQHVLPMPRSEQEGGQSATNPFLQAAQVVPSTGAVIEILVVTGSHGGVGVLFEYGGREYQERYWRTYIINPMKQANIKAKYIVLDACVTASMIPLFAELAAPGGKVLGTMVSLNGTIASDPSSWEKVLAAVKGGTDVGKLIADQLAQSRQGGSIAGASVYAVYDLDSKSMKYENQLVPRLQQIATSANSEEAFTAGEFQRDLRDVTGHLRQRGITGQNTQQVTFDQLKAAVMPVKQVKQRLPLQGLNFTDPEIVVAIEQADGDLDLTEATLFSAFLGRVGDVQQKAPRGADWIAPAKKEEEFGRALNQAGGDAEIAGAMLYSAFLDAVTQIRDGLDMQTLSEAQIAPALRDAEGDADVAAAMILSNTTPAATPTAGATTHQ